MAITRVRWWPAPSRAGIRGSYGLEPGGLRQSGCARFELDGVAVSRDPGRPAQVVAQRSAKRICRRRLTVHDVGGARRELGRGEPGGELVRVGMCGEAVDADDIGPDIVRKIRHVRGRPRIKVRFDPRMEYACGETRVALEPTRIKATTEWRLEQRAVYESMYLWTSLDAEAVRDGSEIELEEDAFLFLSYHDKVQVPDMDLVDLMLQRTRAYWMLWSARTHLPVQYRAETLRSALAILLQSVPATIITSDCRGEARGAAPNRSRS